MDTSILLIERVVMNTSLIFAKLEALRKNLSVFLDTFHMDYPNSGLVADYFYQYRLIRKSLIAEFPNIFPDLPDFTVPAGKTPRYMVSKLFLTIDYILDLCDRSKIGQAASARKEAMSKTDNAKIGHITAKGKAGHIPANEEPRGRVFIGHGRSPVWRELKDFLHDRLHLKPDEFNREATPGITTVERLKKMLHDATFAFLVMTAEDEYADRSKHPRMNVVHEAGLFQGHLGFKKAIILLEEGCTEFSNIHGLTTIRFPQGNIAGTFEEIRRVLEREQVI